MQNNRLYSHVAAKINVIVCYRALPVISLTQQNAAAGVIFQEAKYSHITPLLRELNWFPVKYRIDFKVLLITFKVIHEQAPHFPSELITEG